MTYYHKKGSTTAAESMGNVVLRDSLTGEPLAGSGAASTAVLANMGTPGDVFTFTPTLDTNIYAADDLLFDATEITNFMRVVGGRGIIQSITVIDKDDQGVAFDLFSSPVTVDFGTVNSAPSISDADAILGVQRICRVESSDYLDLGGCRVATITNIGLLVEADAASRSMFWAAVTRGGTPTYTAAGLVLRIGVIWF